MTLLSPGRRNGRAEVRPTAPIARLLVDAVQQRPLAGDYDWSQIDPTELQMAALVHGVAPSTYLHLRSQPGVPQEVTQRLQTSHRDQLARHLRTLSDLRQAGAALNEAGITWTTVKGPVLAERVWPRPDMRAYTDVDLVVDRRRFDDALAALTASGATMVDQNWPFIRQQMRAELTLMLPYGTPLDLHWDLVCDPDMRRVFRFPHEEMYQRIEHVEIGGTTVPTFDAVDSLLHLAYHMVHSGGHKLVWLKDFQLTAALPGIDWDEVVSRARRYGVELALDLTVQRTERVLGPIAGATARGRRFVWSGVAAAADRLRPVPHLPGAKKLSGRIVFQSTRATSAASAVAALRDVRKDREGAPPGSANPLHEVHEDAQARSEYLAAVQGDVCP
jgi:hypothetical protein